MLTHDKKVLDMCQACGTNYIQCAPHMSERQKGHTHTHTHTRHATKDALEAQGYVRQIVNV